MALKLEKGKELLKKVIQNDLRHKDYKRVCDIADEYTKYVTGSDIGTLLKQFTPRESDDLFKQRVKITSLTTPDIANTLATPMYKVGRTTADTSITWKNKETSEAHRKDLTDSANEFWGIASVEKYLTIRMPSMDMTDPNSFIVVEFEGAFDANKPESATNKKVQPYPFEVNSKEAIHYQYINNRLQYLIVLNDVDQVKFTIYLENESIVAIEIKEGELAATKQAFPDAEIWFKDEKIKEKGPIYYVQTFEHKGGMMPARRVGTVLDTETRQRTCVPMIHPAKTYFEKAIKTVSEFDLTNALHTFPKVFRYGNPCPGNMKEGIVCNDGKIVSGEENANCPICKGTGWDNQTTTASEIIVRAPKEMKDMVSLEMMMTYKSPPIELVEFQKELGLFTLKELAIKATYNGDTYVSDTTAVTATAKNIDLESVYDTLKPFADNWSDMWKHIITLIANYRDLKVDVINHTFPKDFKMKSLTMLLADLTLANSSGAPSFIKKSIIHDIAKKMYVDRPGELLKIQTMEKFFPFNGKSENEINYILANGLVSDFDKIFYVKFDSIFFEIEQEMGEGINFYAMDFKKQKALIIKKVDEYIATLEEEGADSRATAFNSAGEKVIDDVKKDDELNPVE